MNRLLAIGFEPAGHWLLEDEKLKYELTRHSTQINILYAFVCDGDVMYVGKTVQTLAKRMACYKTPGKTQSTNIKNNQQILEVLSSGSAVEILALPDNGLLHYGMFHLNLAAALEDDIIIKLNPIWNGGKTEKIPEKILFDKQTISDSSVCFAKTFSFTLQPTYFRSGFFNVGISKQEYFGVDGETIELFLANASQPVLGTINRRANTNRTPRIMGGIALKDWFNGQFREMETVAVQILSPTSIRLSTIQ